MSSGLERLIFDEQKGAEVMEFRLIYKGRLPAETSRSRVDDKHRIRKIFHAQLKELWLRHPSLNWQTKDPLMILQNQDPNRTKDKQFIRLPGNTEGGKPWVEWLADDYARCGFRFAPLIRSENQFTCALSILFLRRGHPGDLVMSGGDIDNRIKVLFDSLKVPRQCNEVKGPPEEGEDPFFCLLEDDGLITSVTITTDRLLTPIEDGEAVNDVELVVHVTVIDPRSLLGPSRLV